jgi:hypothetical protein
MSAKVKYIQSAASEDAAVHVRGSEGFPPHPGRRADEYKVVNKPLTCATCIKLEEEDAEPEVRPEIDRKDLEDDDTTPASITYKVTFDKLDPVTHEVLERIVVENVDADGPMGAIEIAVEDHLRVTVVQENVFVFNPGE